MEYFPIWEVYVYEKRNETLFGPDTNLCKKKEKTEPMVATHKTASTIN